MRSTLVSPPPEANRRVNHGRICPPPPQSSPNWNLLPNNGPYKAHWIKFSTFALLVNAVQTIVADAGKAIVDALHEQRMPTWEERAAFLAYWDYASWQLGVPFATNRAKECCRIMDAWDGAFFAAKEELDTCENIVNRHKRVATEEIAAAKACSKELAGHKNKLAALQKELVVREHDARTWESALAKQDQTVRTARRLLALNQSSAARRIRERKEELAAATSKLADCK